MASLDTESQTRLPSEKTMAYAARIAIDQDKPIMLDYWADSVNNNGVLIAVDESGDRILVKSDDEYTSAIEKAYKMVPEFIIITVNSIYIVSSDIPIRRIVS